MHQKTKDHAHFHGKQPLEHVLAARIKGQIATDEIHGAEMPGHLSAFADAAKETSLLFLLFWSHLSAQGVLIFACGWLIWRTGRSALLGYSRLERMHRVIEEERWEIEHHRPQEKEELRALYQAKGFSGHLLDEAVEVLMADDNRLLQVMLQEELGFRIESEEHPLKQAVGAFAGVFASGTLMVLALIFLPSVSAFIVAGSVIVFAAGYAAKRQKNRVTPAIVWNLACALLAAGVSESLSQLL